MAALPARGKEEKNKADVELRAPTLKGPGAVLNSSVGIACRAWVSSHFFDGAGRQQEAGEVKRAAGGRGKSRAC